MTGPLPYFSAGYPSGSSAASGSPVAMAHRGFSLEGLENSLAAFSSAVELGFCHLETDVHTTSDGELLLFHDRTLDRITDGRGRIHDLTADEVRRVRIGGAEPVPTFDELVAAFPGTRFNLDVKDWHSVPSVVAAIERHQVHDRVLIASFSDLRRRAVLKRLSRRTASSAGTLVNALFLVLGPLLSVRGVRSPVRAVLRRALRDVDALQVPVRYRAIPVVTPEYVRRAHELGLYVHVWTINDPAEMHRLLDLGVDGIVSDRADLLKEVLQARGQWG
ncbi:glycerophosphodiester phosphodiesterase [Arthrobacter globiformis]|uniref:glycerophosphodiester phosphodiesterase n=1 Tax=Arthrobacter TaxID=1663 RepID=UPI0009719F5D|nr:glycerophosphodiester phosphodiesterase [Arthrobacter sp. QXT-31]